MQRLVRIAGLPGDTWKRHHSLNSSGISGLTASSLVVQSLQLCCAAGSKWTNTREAMRCLWSLIKQGRLLLPPLQRNLQNMMESILATNSPASWQVSFNFKYVANIIYRVHSGRPTIKSCGSGQSRDAVLLQKSSILRLQARQWYTV